MRSKAYVESFASCQQCTTPSLFVMLAAFVVCAAQSLPLPQEPGVVVAEKAGCVELRVVGPCHDRSQRTAPARAQRIKTNAQRVSTPNSHSKSRSGRSLQKTLLYPSSAQALKVIKPMR